jgi:hypothetical protein
MAPNTRNISSADKVDQIINNRLLLIAEEIETIGDLRSGVRKNLHALAEQKNQVSDNTKAADTQLYERFAKRTNALDAATKGYEQVRLKDHAGGIQGQNLVGGSHSTATVDRQLVTNAQEMQRVLKHEASEKVGHSSQARPTVAKEEAALIIDGKNVSVTTMLEGDVERGVAIDMGEGEEVKRVGQPEKEYGEGQDAANKIIKLVGERAWNDRLKKNGEKAGNVPSLQQEIWATQLRTGKEAREVLQEAQETGYQKEAMRAIYSHAA